MTKAHKDYFLKIARKYPQPSVIFKTESIYDDTVIVFIGYKNPLGIREAKPILVCRRLKDDGSRTFGDMIEGMEYKTEDLINE